MKYSSTGTILFGRGMMAQLSYEMSLLNVKNPVILTRAKNMGKAIKAGRLLLPGISSNLPIQINTPSNDHDFLILAGDADLALEYLKDERPKALVPLFLNDLISLKAPVSEYLVLDDKLIPCKKSTIINEFFYSYASAASDIYLSSPENLSIPGSFTFSSRTSVIRGDQALEELPRLLEELEMKAPLILTDRGIEAVGLLDLLKSVLGDRDILIFNDIPPDSDIEIVNQISHLYGEENRDGIIALGGGSVLDTSKGVYLNVSLGTEDLSAYSGSGIIPRLYTPFICVPTTSGTGSEVTKVAVISDKTIGRKNLYNSNHLQPDYGVLDSRLTASLPPFLSSITTMDALSHAVEAFTCLGKNPMSDLFAWNAIELIRDHLFPMMREPQNWEHRSALALASNFAGRAFSNSMVGMVHTIGHSVGAVCHAPHGSCMSILLPHGLEYNSSFIEEELKQLKMALAGGASGESAIQIIRKMNQTLFDMTEGRHPLKFSDIKNREGEPLVRPDQFEDIARTALGDASIVYNPRELRFDDIMMVLNKAY